MSTLARIVSMVGVCFALASAIAADAPKDSPFGQAGTPATMTTALDSIDFSGVSTVGNRTMINLYDRPQKRSFWVEVGKPSGDLTVTNYDSAHDQITVKSKGAQKVLPLRPPSAVVNGATPVVATPAASPALSASVPGATTTTSTQSLSQARQEEEARMLVSDLLEIGMAQRKAYEEAQRRAAAGLPPHPAQTPDANTVAPTATQPASTQPATTTTPSS